MAALKHETPAEVEILEPQPVSVKQMVSHGSDLFILTSEGKVWRRFLDPKNFNSGPGWSEKHLWQPVDVPHI